MELKLKTMKIGKYISPSGELQNVIQVDEENKRVEVDYGTHCHWWGEVDYQTWVSEDEEETEDTGEIVLDYVKEEKIPEKAKPKKKPTAKTKTKKK